VLEALLLPTLLALGAALPTGVTADTTPVEPAPTVLRWHDAGRPRASVRVGPSRVAGRTQLDVYELDSGRSYRAEVGAEALLTLTVRADATSRALPGLDELTVELARHGVQPLRIWLTTAALQVVWVRSLRGEDGLALAARLAPTHTIMPDLYLAQRATGGTTGFDDPLLTSQWYVRRLGLEAAWALEDGDPSVTIMVNDNGCDLEHPDLVAKLDDGADVLDDDGDASYFPRDNGNEHGTACAGLIGAQGNNAEGIVGACPECRVRCVRMLAPPPGLVAISDNVQAFTYGRDVGAVISSNSWGFSVPTAAPDPLRRAIVAFIEGARDGKGGFVVFAAGNDDRLLLGDELTGIPGVITVSATNNFDEATTYTNFGADVDLAAPTGTFTTDIRGAEGAGPMDYTASFGGTSSACPVVAGILGLLVSAAPERTADELQAALRASLKPAPFATPGPDGHDPYYGYGIVDPAAAVRALLPPPLDAGVPDSGAADDATPAPDAAELVVDAGVVVADAAPADASGTIEEAGCGCAATRTGARADVWLLVLAGLAAVRRGARRLGASHTASGTTDRA
jgi:subtilisin family serine protease